MRYRATPAVCNGCPVKDTCTTSDTGREVTRSVDPWPASEADRFHRGIACTIAVLGVLWPLAVTLSDRTWTERAVLAGVVLLIAAGRPLWSHLRRTTAASRRMSRLTSGSSGWTRRWPPMPSRRPGKRVGAPGIA